MKYTSVNHSSISIKAGRHKGPGIHNTGICCILFTSSILDDELSFFLPFLAMRLNMERHFTITDLRNIGQPAPHTYDVLGNYI